MHYVIISDIHANHNALEAVLGAVSKLCQGTRDIRYWFLGDLVGYGPSQDAAECLNWLRYRSGIYRSGGNVCEGRWVPGNHDEWIVKGYGLARPEAVVTLLHQRALLMSQHHDDWLWFKRAVEQAIADEQRTLLRDGDEGLVLALTHAAVNSRRMEYLRPWNKYDLCAAFRNLNHQQAPSNSRTTCLVHGHTHLPILVKITDTSVVALPIRYGVAVPLPAGNYIINPGSVGHPRDGDPRAAFAVVDTEAATVTFHRVPYKVRPVVNRLLAQGNTYAENQEAIAYLLRRTGDAVTSTSSARCFERVRDVIYPKLRREIEEGYGGQEERLYRGVYRPMDWGLEVVDS